MKKVFIEIFECPCCKFVERIVRSSIRGYEDIVECRNYSLSLDRALFEKLGIEIKETRGKLTFPPTVILRGEGGKEERIHKINRTNIQRALASFL